MMMEEEMEVEKEVEEEDKWRRRRRRRRRRKRKRKRRRRWLRRTSGDGGGGGGVKTHRVDQGRPPHHYTRHPSPRTTLEGAVAPLSPHTQLPHPPPAHSWLQG